MEATGRANLTASFNGHSERPADKMDVMDDAAAEEIGDEVKARVAEKDDDGVDDDAPVAEMRARARRRIAGGREEAMPSMVATTSG